ncbi:MFS transporter [Streptomyces sp. NPDC056835]|uniref:MFS transporter n=1 Tax=Streptomyces sp. NPDC056835 TaxID=3345956 RepID=UPI0036805A0D
MTAPETKAATPLGIWGILKGDRRFLLLWIAQLLATVGTTVGSVVKPIYILQQGSASALGYYLSATTLATLVALPFGGALADRCSRIMLIGLSFLASVVGSVLLLTSAQGAMLPVLGAAACSGAGVGFYLPASRAVVVDLVGVDRMEEAQSLLMASQHVLALVGPALTGVMLTMISVRSVLVAQTACYLLAFCVIPAVGRLDKATESAEPPPPRRLASVKDALVTFIKVPWVSAGAAQTALQIFLGFAPGLVLIRVVSDERYGNAALGLILATSGLAGLLGTIVAGRWRPRLPGLWSNIGFVSYAGVELCLAVDVPLWVFCVSIFIGGFGISWHGIWWYGAINRRFSDELRGRINSLDALTSKLLEPVGMALAIPVAAVIGVQSLAFVGVAVFVAVPLLSLLVPGLARYSDPRAPEPSLTK